MNYLTGASWKEEKHGDHIINGEKSYYTGGSIFSPSCGFSLGRVHHFRYSSVSTRGGLKQALVDEALTVVELISKRKGERRREKIGRKKKTRGTL